MTEWVKGKTLDEAMTINNSLIAEELALPPVKIHCSILSEDAIKAAVIDYKAKHGTASAKSGAPTADTNTLKFPTAEPGIPPSQVSTMLTRLRAWMRTSLAVHTAPGWKSRTQTFPVWARAVCGSPTEYALSSLHASPHEFLSRV